jgi:hypothetical protein
MSYAGMYVQGVRRDYVPGMIAAMCSSRDGSRDGSQPQPQPAGGNEPPSKPEPIRVPIIRNGKIVGWTTL